MLRTCKKLTLFALLSLATTTQAFDVTGGQTGAWFDPSHDGEGYILQIINDSQAVVFWFTYDKQGNQAWMIGVGEINGSKISFPELVAPVGGKFGADFDPEEVERPVWGTLEFEFTSCDAAEVSYAGPADFGNGQLGVVRLTAPWGVGCDGTQGPPPGQGDGFLNPGFTGAWFDQGHDGEGFTLEVLDESTALVYWFTFTADGEPAWMVAIADIVGAQIFAEDVLITSGGRFGPDFDPDEVVRTFWGQAIWSFGSCNNGGMRYVGPEAFGPESTQTLVRLTGIDKLQCAFNSNTYSASGKLGVADNVYLDGDTNDKSSPMTPNNGDDGYQDIYTPATVAGFLTVDPTGEAGSRFEDTADEVDIYRIFLRSDEQVTLQIADHDPDDPESVDLDLWLYDVSNTDEPVASSLTIDATESVTAPFEGEFWVLVNAYSGASNYAFRTGFDIGFQYASLDYSASSVPDQLMVQYGLGSIAQPGKGKLSHTEAVVRDEQVHGLRRISGASDGSAVYKLDSPYADMLAEHEFPLAKYGFRIQDNRKWMVIKTAKSLGGEADVRYAQPNYLSETQVKPNDPFYANQWHYKTIHLEQAWNLTTGDKDVVVAVLDSGVAPHSDLVGNVNYSLGFDFANDFFLSETYDGEDGIDSDARDPGPAFSITPYTSHGSHVAGTIGAVSNNNSGLAGVAWNVTIMPIRTDLSCASVVQGLKWAARLPNASGRVPARRADIVNMSFGSYAQCAAETSALSQLRSRGIILVAAAGNDGRSQVMYPAATPGVVAVSATNYADGLTWYSNFGSPIDVAAPGGDRSQWLSPTGFADGVWSPTFVQPAFSSYYFPDLKMLEGTSMASPHVAGVAALMKSVFPNMTADEFDVALTSGAITTDLALNGSSTPDNQFGYGRIDARKAVNWALEAANGMPSETFITASTSSLDFGSNHTGLVVDIQKSGSAEITLDSYSRRYEWIEVEGVSVNNSNFGQWRIVVNRSGLARGIYRDVMTFFASNGSQVSVNLVVQVGETIKGEAGYVYATLIDAYSWTSMKWWGGKQQNDHYSIGFNGLAPGAYYILIGSDMDSDGFICDAGEFCQIYPSWSDPQLVEVVDNSVQLKEFIMIPPDVGVGVSSASLQSNTDAPARRDSGLLPAVGGRGIKRPKSLH